MKSASEKKIEYLKKANEKADEVVETLIKVRSSIDGPAVDATVGQKTIARRNISKILSDVDKAKKDFEQELSHADISEKYWKSVKTAREKFADEFKILYPNFNLQDKKLPLNDEDFNLFVLHVFHRISFYQKELEKLQVCQSFISYLDSFYSLIINPWHNF